MAKEDTEQLLPLTIELDQLVRVPEHEPDDHFKLLLVTARTSKRSSRTFASTFGGTDPTVSTGHFSMIPVAIGIKQFCDGFASVAFER
jgi:hypothetical protein